MNATRAVAVALVATSLVACKKEGEKDLKEAAANAATLAQIVEKDVGDVERGLPEGGKQLGALFDKGDPKQDLTSVKNALVKVRAGVEGLHQAKTTFFVLLDADGVAIRSDWKTDSMAQKAFFPLFPSLPEAKAKPYFAGTGQFVSTAADRDMDWIAAVPVKKSDGTVAGLFVTGWPYRHYAKNLQEIMRNRLIEQSKKDDSKVPIFYVALFDAAQVYTPLGTPPVIEKALSEQDLAKKTASGPSAELIQIESRTYACAAARVEKMAKDTGVVVLRSDL